jgi:hypothetical protein
VRLSRITWTKNTGGVLTSVSCCISSYNLSSSNVTSAELKPDMFRWPRNAAVCSGRQTPAFRMQVQPLRSGLKKRCWFVVLVAFILKLRLMTYLKREYKLLFMLISPCIVNQFLKMFQQDDTFFGQYFIPCKRLYDPPTTTEGHRLFVTTRCCNYSLFELLMMGECFTRNMWSSLQGIKYCTKKVSSFWNIFKKIKKKTSFS